MQHHLVIKDLENAREKISGCKLIFPMTYGWRGVENRAKVKNNLEKSSLDALIIEEFLPIERLQQIRLADIFINIPSSDQFQHPCWNI